MSLDGGNFPLCLNKTLKQLLNKYKVANLKNGTPSFSTPYFGLWTIDIKETRPEALSLCIFLFLLSD